MPTFRTIKSLNQCLRGYRASDLRVGFATTMSNLHTGHRALIDESVARSYITVVSIFVNPTQFGPNEDVDHYPRAVEQDYDFWRKAGLSLILVPNASQIYQPGFQTTIEPGPISELLCGSVRPGHFCGGGDGGRQAVQHHAAGCDPFRPEGFPAMCCDPADGAGSQSANRDRFGAGRARGGWIDAQQANQLLSPIDRERARCFCQGLLTAQAVYGEGQRDGGRLIEITQAHMTEVDQLQDLELQDARTLEVVPGLPDQSAAIFVTAYVRATRMTDNVILDLTSGELGMGIGFPIGTLSAVLGNPSSGVL